MGFNYRDKYITSDDIYREIKDDIDLNEKEFKRLIKAFCKEFTEELVYNKKLVHIPNQMGYCYIKKTPHKRPFHVRVDWEEFERTGEIVKYKVPILDDYYYKLVWTRKGNMNKCKMMPLRAIQHGIKEVLKTDDF